MWRSPHFRYKSHRFLVFLPPSPLGSDGLSQRVEGAAHWRNQSPSEEGDRLLFLQRGVGKQWRRGGGRGKRDAWWDRACQWHPEAYVRSSFFQGKNEKLYRLFIWRSSSCGVGHVQSMLLFRGWHKQWLKGIICSDVSFSWSELEIFNGDSWIM